MNIDPSLSFPNSFEENRFQNTMQYELQYPAAAADDVPVKDTGMVGAEIF
jgi:hypothetical protein